MPRDSAGVYTLPAGNPVVTGTVIASPWANTTLSDIAAQLNNVLTRDGLLGPTSPFKIQDGTVAAPGLAWNSEPGFGWYRISAGIMAVAQGGIQRLVSENAAALTKFKITGNGTNHATNLEINTMGTGVPQVLGQKNNTNRWLIQMGNQIAESGANAGSDFSIFPYDDAGTALQSAFYIQRSNGTTRLDARTGMAFYAAGVERRFSMGASASGDWEWRWVSGSGNLVWNRNSGQPQTTLTALGDIIAGRDIYCGSGNQLALIQSATPGVSTLRFTSDQWKLEWQAGNLTYFNTSPVPLWQVTAAGNMVVPNGTGYKPGGGAWADTSDARIKENIQPFVRGLDAILSLEPVSYSFKAETGRDVTQRYIRLIAQDAKVGFPELVTVEPGELGELKYDDLHTLDESPVLWALVNAVKTLDKRIAQLEHA